MTAVLVQNAHDGADAPYSVPAGGWDAAVGQIPLNEGVGLALQKQGVDQAHDLRLRFNDLREPVRAFFITQEPLVWQGNLAARHALALSPGDVLADRP